MTLLRKMWRTSIGVGLSLVLGGVLVAVGTLDAHTVSVPVVIVGGSAAKGWFDQTHQGYIARALYTYSKQADIRFHIENHAVPGAPVTSHAIAQHFPIWMHQTPGGVAVIGWGLLNDLRLKTSRSAVLHQVHREIALALATHHLVLVVSPPATVASFTFDRQSQATLWHQIEAQARTFHSPDVYVASIFGAMKTYIMAHNQNPINYMQGKWDPNTRGHALAGRLLDQKLNALWHKRVPEMLKNGT